MPTLIAFFINFIPTVVTFFGNLLKKITITSIVLPIQITFLIALYIAKFAFITAMVTVIVWLYNRFVSVFDLINTYGNASNISQVLDFLRSIGFIQALNETFAYFSFILVSFLILFLSKLLVSSLQMIADEYYKIGVLIQLGIK